MNAAIYARQSVDKKDSLSIDGQIQICSQICESRGWKYEVFSDPGYSGKNMDRPQFQKMLGKIEQGSINMLMAYRLDRISRSLADFTQLIAFLNKHGAEFYSATEQFETNTPTGRALVSIIMTFAQLERETISQRLKDSVHHRVIESRHWHGAAPYGYHRVKRSIDGKRGIVLEVDSDTSVWLKFIFDSYLSGSSLRAIAHRLNEEHVTTTLGKTWGPIAVRRVLLNPSYCPADAAMYRYFDKTDADILDEPSRFDGSFAMALLTKGEKPDKIFGSRFAGCSVIVGRHKPLINSVDWLAVQKRISKNKALARTGTSKLSWLSGLCKCPVCGSTLHLTKQRKYVYLRCDVNVQKGNFACTNHWMPRTDVYEEILEPQILDYIKNIDASNVPMTQTADVDKGIDAEILAIDKKIDALVDQLLDSGAAAPYIRTKIAELDEKKREIIDTAEKTAIHMERGLMDSAAAVETLSKQWYTLQPYEKSTYLRQIIDNIELQKNGNVAIYWKYKVCGSVTL